ncbi:CYTH domain-containing protein [Kitasatospora sp. NPDC093550]|uniref:CYTH domain-containing protein n=1 Tax=Kitasatospora sp. NPDC093550 TaxID=3364089 RepID=UPI0038007D58
MGIEIERKFLADRPALEPPLPRAERILQGYVTIGRKEVRLRSHGDRFFLTVKEGAGVLRSEYEVELHREQFAELWPATDGARLEKTRAAVPIGSAVAALDEYRGRLEGLRTVEVEFASLAVAETFEPPAWFGAEITGQDGYRNQALAVLPRWSARDR